MAGRYDELTEDEVAAYNDEGLCLFALPTDIANWLLRMWRRWAR